MLRCPFLESPPPDESDDESHAPMLAESEDEWTPDGNDEGD